MAKKELKIVIAPDKFKGSLTGIEFCSIVEKGIKSVLPEAEIIKLPMADGGDGTIEILNFHLEGKSVKVSVNNPIFKPVEASYLFMDTIDTAFIEMAEVSGIILLKPEEQNCFETTTFGTGEIILDAINKGAKTIILGIGGSATNDVGIGMATALGFKFFDKKNNIIIPIGKNLSEIVRIDSSNVNPLLHDISFKVACDVTNPLYGSNGAAFVYASQKGASKDEVIQLNNGLEHISKIFIEQFNIDVQGIKGSGSAGGLGAGAVVFLNANLVSGIDLVKELVNFDYKIKEANWIITGEGKLDSQTLSGKTIQGVLESAKRQDISVAVLCGSISLEQKFLNKLGISYSDSILNKANNIEDAMERTRDYLTKISKVFANQFK